MPAIIAADDQSDPAFYEATKGSVLLPPGEAYEFTFTRPGEYGHHGKPWQQGTVIVREC